MLWCRGIEIRAAGPIEGLRLRGSQGCHVLSTAQQTSVDAAHRQRALAVVAAVPVVGMHGGRGAAGQCQ